MKNLGIVEGFYGESLDFVDRNSIIKLLSENNLNYYLYAPKEDPFLRNHLDLEPTPEWQNAFKDFVDLSNESNVTIGVGLAPINKKHTADLAKKIELFMNLGVSSFSLLFDDIEQEFSLSEQLELFEQTKTKFNGLIVIKNKIFKDKRGYFKELFREKEINKKFPFIVMSLSKKNVIRGLHLQNKSTQGKYISVIKGKIFDVALDLRKGSKTFGKYFSIFLSEKNSISVYIPPGFAHGFLGLKKENIIYYLNTQYQKKKSAIGILWNDKDLKIKWPIKNPILSKQDKKNITFTNFKKLNLRKT